LFVQRFEIGVAEGGGEVDECLSRKGILLNTAADVFWVITPYV